LVPSPSLWFEGRGAPDAFTFEELTLLEAGIAAARIVSCDNATLH